MFGVNQSKEIVRNENFNSIEKIMESDEEALKQIDGIGDIVASNIYNFFRKEKNRDIILKLKEHGIRMEVQEEKENLEDIEIVFDSSSIELFANGGSFTISTRFYPENHDVKILATNYVAKELGAIEIREEN